MSRRLLALFTAVFSLALSKPAVVLACAVCLAGDGTQGPISDAFNSSVLFLMAMPYVVVGSIGGWLFYLYRCAVRKGGSAKKKAPLLRLAWNHKESGNE
jgi:hypothetical protein